MRMVHASDHGIYLHGAHRNSERTLEGLAHASDGAHGKRWCVLGGSHYQPLFHPDEDYTLNHTETRKRSVRSI